MTYLKHEDARHQLRRRVRQQQREVLLVVALGEKVHLVLTHGRQCIANVYSRKTKQTYQFRHPEKAIFAGEWSSDDNESWTLLHPQDTLKV